MKKHSNMGAPRATLSRVVIALAIGATTSAFAADPSALGIMSFPNVKVVNAPAATIAAPAATQPGMRAFKDPVTGAMRQPTSEELQIIAADEPAMQRTEGQIFLTQTGAEAVMLDESYLQYAVVSRRPDGSLAEMCIPGRATSDALVNNTTWAKNAKGDDHVR
jgi:hypothetical protein